MKRLVFFLAVCLAAVVPEVSYATIDIDISYSRVEIIDLHSIKIRDVSVAGYAGTYWVKFQWDAEMLVFVPIDAGAETDMNTWTVIHSDTQRNSMQVTINIDRSNRVINLSFRVLSGLIDISYSRIEIQQGSNYFTLSGSYSWSISENCSLYSSSVRAVFFGNNQWSGGEYGIHVGETRSGVIRCIPSWFNFNLPFTFIYWGQSHILQ